MGPVSSLDGSKNIYIYAEGGSGEREGDEAEQRTKKEKALVSRRYIKVEERARIGPAMPK